MFGPECLFELRDRVAVFHPPAYREGADVPCCVQCGDTLARPGACLAGAGQAYEDLSTEVISEVVDAFFTDLPKITKCHTVTVTDKKQGFSISWGGNNTL